MRSLRRLAIGAAVGLSLLGQSERASAQFFAFPGPSDPNEIGGMTWVVVSMAALGASVPQIVAGIDLHDGKQDLSKAAGAGLFGPGLALSLLIPVGLGFADRNEGTTALTVLGGPIWSMTGVGLGRLVSTSPHATWLGGSMGWSSFALLHGIMAQAGAADYWPSSLMQSFHAAVGGTGCIIDAASSSGAERAVGIGCGVVSGLAFVHGVVRVATGAQSGHRAKAPKRHAFLPMPWASGSAAGLSLAGAF